MRFRHLVLPFVVLVSALAFVPSASAAKRQTIDRTATVRLQSSATMTARRSPTSSSPGGTVRNGETFTVRCQVNGGRKSGKYGASRIWDQVKLQDGSIAYISDAMTQTSSKASLVAPYCGLPDPTATSDAQGRCSSQATVSLVAAPKDRRTFIATAGPFAVSSQKATQVPASVTLAQAILESASGTLTAGANNYFGIKAQAADRDAGTFTWGTQAVGCVHKPTFENEGGLLVRQIGQFRMYEGMRGSFVDHGLFLRQNSRYAPAFRTTTADSFARAIHRAGYATDPSYSAKLISLMNVENLKQYDR
jgi:flagellum-specific peptidoglycan hydrolase FlgJ